MGDRFNGDQGTMPILRRVSPFCCFTLYHRPFPGVAPRQTAHSGWASSPGKVRKSMEHDLSKTRMAECHFDGVMTVALRPN